MDAAANTAGVETPAELRFTMSRVFDAPRDEVFRLNLDPSLIPDWWGPRNLTTRVDKMDVRPGGEWRFVQRDAQGTEYAFHGTYQEIDRPARLIQTFVYEGSPNDVIVETVTFEDLDGHTRVTTTDVFATREARDEAMRSGMEHGAAESMDRFGEVLARRR